MKIRNDNNKKDSAFRVFVINTLVFCFVIFVSVKLYDSFFINENNLLRVVSNVINYAGFGGFEFKDSSLKNNALVLSGVALDQDGFSTVRNIEVKYKKTFIPPFFRVENIIISGAELAVVVSQSEKHEISYEISGANNIAFDKLLDGIKEIGGVELKNLRLEVDIPKIGVINADFNVKIRYDDDNRSLNFTLAGKSIQNQLAVEITSNGYISDFHEWLFEGEIYNARYSGNDLKAQRVSGWFSVGKKDVDSELQFGSRINVGILSYLGLELHNVTSAVSGVSSDFRIITEGNIRDENNSHFYSNIGKENKKYAGYLEADIKSNSSTTEFLEKVFGLPQGAVDAPITVKLRFPHSESLPQDFQDIKIDFLKTDNKPAVKK